MPKLKKWFSVKLIYTNEIVGKPNPKLIDKNFSKDFIAFEEVILLIHAFSFEEAIKKAKSLAKKNESDHINIYDQKVKTRLHSFIECFWLFDDVVKHGTELYSNIITTSARKNKKKFIKDNFPIQQKGSIYMLLHKEFNRS
jgi:hypothetical protein